METQDKIHNPLFAELFRIALPQLEGYQSDLGHDTLRLASAMPGEHYLWGVRKYGTEMQLLDDDPAHRIAETVRIIKAFPEHRWYLLEITEVRQDGYCAGTVQPVTLVEPTAERPAEAAPHDPLHAYPDYPPEPVEGRDGSRPSDPIQQDN